MSIGTKHDTNKPRASLLAKGFVPAVIRVLEHGAKVHGDNNWRDVPNARERYYNAVKRHLVAWWEEGELADKDTGESHLAHAVCSLMFLWWLDAQGSKPSPLRELTK